jgi:hypothetical protein
MDIEIDWTHLGMCLLVAFVACLSFWYFLGKMFRRSAQAMLMEFRQRFPGKCAVCAYHRWGINMGYEKKGTKPGDHGNCPEK